MSLTIIIFLLTLVFVIWQPKGLSIGWPTTIGALLVLLLGIVSISDLVKVVGIVWNATLTFVGIIIISLLLDRIGFFKWAALSLAKLAHGDGRFLFILIIVFGALVAALFANDGSALMLTPIVIEITTALNFDQKATFPFIIACGFIADATSLPLIISNLINIISANFFQISFSHYALIMLVPNLVALTSSLLILFYYFRKQIPRSYQLNLIEDPTTAIPNQSLFKLSWLILALLLVGYFISGPLNIPVSFIVLSIALLFLVAYYFQAQTSVVTIIKGAPWNIVVFSIGMYVVVYGLQNIGLINYLSAFFVKITKFGGIINTLGIGYLAAFLSSLMNNLPATMINVLTIKATNQTSITQQMQIYANVIGSDLGPKLTPIGSLATLVWLQVLAKRGIKISWWEYCKIGFIFTIPVLFVTLLALYVSLLIFG
ncbi:arsenic transporter [Fructilactobacillus hinvesii]|uniref:Arsenical pump membrane protein n=1 Tax=Fructilactobacillus hinvesii TaxID=2940300 RepID=A0ABY5BVU4_9LACO|nr:arsenic transporter [Fructilactobacillus hinvesii]